MNPIVTLAVTTLNRPSCLREAMSCAMEQDYKELDILVSDNGSTEQTGSVIQELSKSDARVRYRRNEQTVPIHEHFTQCVLAARGEYFILLHDDDLINARFVSEVVEVARRCPEVHVVVPSNVTINECGGLVREFCKPRNETFEGSEFVCHWLENAAPQFVANVTTVLLRTELVRHFGGYKPFGGGRNIDNLLFLQCAVSGYVGFAQGAVFKWRVYQKSFGSAATPLEIADSGREFLKYLHSDVATVRALSRVAVKRRRRIVRAVGRVTAIEVAVQIEMQRVRFDCKYLVRTLLTRQDLQFVYTVLREYFRHNWPALHAFSRDCLRRCYSVGQSICAGRLQRRE